jgi:two-component system chemotaxis response regulator CheY
MARILIVDDAKFMRTVLKNILVPNGYDIADEAADGVEAIEKYRKLRPKPDLVLLDIIMPNIDGIETLKGIKSIDPDAKVIMITAMGQESMINASIKHGAKGYITKPFQAPEVLEEIKKVLSS